MLFAPRARSKTFKKNTAWLTPLGSHRTPPNDKTSADTPIFGSSSKSILLYVAGPPISGGNTPVTMRIFLFCFISFSKSNSPIKRKTPQGKDTNGHSLSNKDPARELHQYIHKHTIQQQVANGNGKKYR